MSYIMSYMKRAREVEFFLECPLSIAVAHRMMWAAVAGPYQSPAFFPWLLPISTSWCRPNGQPAWSTNHDTTILWVASLPLPPLSSRLQPILFVLALGHSAEATLVLEEGRGDRTSRSSLVTWCEAAHVHPTE